MSRIQLFSFLRLNQYLILISCLLSVYLNMNELQFSFAWFSSWTIFGTFQLCMVPKCHYVISSSISFSIIFSFLSFFFCSEYMTYVLEALEVEDTIKNFERRHATGWYVFTLVFPYKLFWSKLSLVLIKKLLKHAM